MNKPIIATGPDAIRALVGAELGRSDWVEITQERVDQFADATGDHQWIHVDTERAGESPFGGLVAHGFLTLSLVPSLIPQIVDLAGFKLGVNYGLEKVRFPAPVPVGSRISATLTIDSVTDVVGGIHIVLTAVVEVEGGGKPCCVATLVVRLYL